MVQRLNEFGHAVSWERVQAIAGGENIGRPHVARAMVEAGVVPTIKDAFTEEFILDGGRCYVQRVKITPTEAIEQIHRAGGVAVAAHPGRTGLSDEDVAVLVVFRPGRRRGSLPAALESRDRSVHASSPGDTTSW